MESQNTVPAVAVGQGVDDAAYEVYNGLNDAGYSTEDKIAIIKAVGGLVRSDIDEAIKGLQRLKTSF